MGVATGATVPLLEILVDTIKYRGVLRVLRRFKELACRYTVYRNRISGEPNDKVLLSPKPENRSVEKFCWSLYTSKQTGLCSWIIGFQLSLR